MSTDEYVPDEQALEVAWIEFEGSADDINVASTEFQRSLARVRRDAAREALDGLIGALNTSVHEIQNGPTPNPVAWQTGALWTRDLAKIRRDTHYPEENPRD